MKKNIQTYTKTSSGQKRYDTYLTAEDKRLMRRCHDRGRPLSEAYRNRIFGANPIFKER